MYYNPIPVGKECKIAVKTRWIVRDGGAYEELPHIITWPSTGKTYVVDQVLDSSFDPETQTIEYTIRIGNYTTQIWKRPGGYFALSRR